MPAPVHEEYHELVFEFSTDAGTTWARNCVIMNCEVTRQTNVAEVETVQDCNNEALPNKINRRAQSISVSFSGTGNWTQGGYNTFLEKFYAGDDEPMLARIGNLAALVGDIEYETGPIIVTSLGQARTKGQVVTASIEVSFAETPTTSVKVAP